MEKSSYWLCNKNKHIKRSSDRNIEKNASSDVRNPDAVQTWAQEWVSLNK